MEDRHEEVLKQYNLKVQNTYRARGALLLDTDQGIKLYKGFEGSKNRLEFENKIKTYLVEKGYQNVDITLRNIKDELVTEDSLGGRYTVKNWFLGEECNLRNKEDLARASDNLGKLHVLLKGVPFLEGEIYYDTRNLIEVFEKHNRELKRVRGYIRGKKQKNEFEVRIMNSFDEFYEQAEMATSLLRELNYNELLMEAKVDGTVSHGSYTYHNVLFYKDMIATTNFEKANVGVQVFDLYYFLRKAMEKNEWKLSGGNIIIDAYHRSFPMKEKDRKLLYILSLYPEKYWKIINFYYNGKKSWISHRNLQKLMSVKDQNEERKVFLEKMFTL